MLARPSRACAAGVASNRPSIPRSMGKVTRASVTHSRLHVRAYVAEASTPASTYDGTVMFHVYDTLDEPRPIFGTFLEGALHVIEVARFHPNFVSAHFHYALGNGEQKIDSKTPNSCFNVALLESVAPGDAFAVFEDLIDACEMGHANQVEHLLACKEVATYVPNDESGTSPFSRIHAKRLEMIEAGRDIPVFGFDEANVVLFIGVKAKNPSDVATDSSWALKFGISTAQALVGADKFKDASLFEVVKCSKPSESDHRFTHIVRASLGPVASDESLVSAVQETIRQACAAIDPDALILPYACVYNIGKKGTPPGALPAVREMAKKKKDAALAESR